eukprot:Rhum_TRINITY_DN12902_c0_g1::Rhum_TRINITY_DN12902_c0_g1_i1::g.55350::m.55350
MGWLSDCAAPVAGLGRALCAFGQNQFLQGIQDTLSDTFGITVLSAAEPRCDMLGVSAAVGGAEDEGGDGMARILQQCLLGLFLGRAVGLLGTASGILATAPRCQMIPFFQRPSTRLPSPPITTNAQSTPSDRWRTATAAAPSAS